MIKFMAITKNSYTTLPHFQVLQAATPPLMHSELQAGHQLYDHRQ